jgi:hypothetical protein
MYLYAIYTAILTFFQDENGALANFFPNTDFTFSQAGKSRPIDQALALFSYK